LIGRKDEDVSAAVLAILQHEGIDVRLTAKCIRLAKGVRPGTITAVVECTEGAPEIHGSHVLIATGRCPNADDLGPENAGVHVDHRGYITVDDQLRTNVPGIWASEIAGNASVSKLSQNSSCCTRTTCLASEKQIPQGVGIVGSRTESMELLEPVLPSWAQGVGSSNLPAPTRINTLQKCRLDAKNVKAFHPASAAAHEKHSKRLEQYGTDDSLCPASQERAGRSKATRNGLLT
jgi:hypothetical protein